MRILCYGSLNIDMIFTVPHFVEAGETLSSSSMTRSAGGKGANQAVAAKRLGGDVDFVCKVGNDMFGKNSVAKYAEEGIGTDNILYSDKPSGVALITVDGNAENCIVVASGANAEVTPEDIESLAPAIKDADIILLQLEIPIDSVVKAAKLGKEAGAKVILNPAPACSLPPTHHRPSRESGGRWRAPPGISRRFFTRKTAS